MANEKIYITGITASGKTTLAQLLSKKLNIDHIEINSFVHKYDLYWGYDINRDALIVDTDLLIEKIIEKISSSEHGFCLVGSVFELPLKFDLFVILRCDIPELRKRLKKRGYSDQKIEENVEAEIMDIIPLDILDLYPNEPVIELSTSERSIEETVDIITEVLSSGNYKEFEPACKNLL